MTEGMANLDWRSLASAVVDGTSSAEEQAQLTAWLAERPENADDYVLWLELHDELRAHGEEGALRRRVGVAPARAAGSPLGSALATRPLVTLAAWSMAVAASLMVGLWSGGWLRAPEEAAGSVAANGASMPQEDSATPIAATLTGAVDCRWEEGTRGIGYGEHVPSGTVLRLSEGLAQLTYESGAKVVLRGPSEFHVEGPTKGVLPIGQITAVVPRRAAGFIVTTPCAEIIDLGTEFAIDVDSNGKSQVHVFKGEVVSRRLDEGPEGESLHLTTAQAAEYQPEDGAVREFRADESRFVREITPRLTASELPRGAQQKGLALWLAADLLVKTDPERRVVAWRDVLCGDNQASDDALQSNEWERPVLVPAGMNGVDTLRFDGLSSYLVTTPMETHASQTVFMVARPTQEQPAYLQGSMLNYNGPPHRDLDQSGFRAEEGVLQLGLGGQDRGRYGLQAFVYVGGSARAGNVNSPAITPDEPVVVAYTYNLFRNRAQLHVNGREADRASAPAPASATSRRVIGRHGYRQGFFSGDIAEVLIYDRALGYAERTAVTNYLAEKYHLEGVRRDPPSESGSDSRTEGAPHQAG